MTRSKAWPPWLLGRCRRFTAAGIDFAAEADDRARRGELLQLQDLGGHARPGGSSWQSLARSAGSIETDYLNGEIVLLGRLYGVPTPVNELLQHLANVMARCGAPPGNMPAEELLARADARAGHR